MPVFCRLRLRVVFAGAGDASERVQVAKPHPLRTVHRPEYSNFFATALSPPRYIPCVLRGSVEVLCPKFASKGFACWIHLFCVFFIFRSIFSGAIPMFIGPFRVH